MITSLPFPSSSSLIFETVDLSRSKIYRTSSTISCSSSSRNNSFIPKLEPFSRNKFDRGVKELPLLEKSENDLADYCSVREGDESYSCWRAYFELKDLEKDLSKEDLEMLVIESGGMKSLIDCVHGISTIQKKKTETVNESLKTTNNEVKEEKKVVGVIVPFPVPDGLPKTQEEIEEEEKVVVIPFPVPDGLPKTQEEIEEEEEGKMPDSSFTKLLRNKGKSPPWFSPQPDHQTD